MNWMTESPHPSENWMNLLKRCPVFSSMIATARCVKRRTCWKEKNMRKGIFLLPNLVIMSKVVRDQDNRCFLGWLLHCIPPIANWKSKTIILKILLMKNYFLWSGDAYLSDRLLHWSGWPHKQWMLESLLVPQWGSSDDKANENMKWFYLVIGCET